MQTSFREGEESPVGVFSCGESNFWCWVVPRFSWQEKEKRWTPYFTVWVMLAEMNVRRGYVPYQKVVAAPRRAPVTLTFGFPLVSMAFILLVTKSNRGHVNEAGQHRQRRMDCVFLRMLWNNDICEKSASYSKQPLDSLMQLKEERWLFPIAGHVGIWLKNRSGATLYTHFMWNLPSLCAKQWILIWFSADQLSRFWWRLAIVHKNMRYDFRLPSSRICS